MTVRQAARLIYIANVRLPTEKAHGLQIVRMCEAFQTIGLRTSLLHSHRRQPEALEHVDPLTYYGVREAFEIRRLPNVDVTRVESWVPAGLFTGLHYTHATLWASYAVAVARRLGAADLYVTRDIPVAMSLVRHGLPTVLELHQAPRRWSLTRLRRVIDSPHLRVLVTMTRALKDALATKGLPVARAAVLHDGVDQDRYEDRTGREPAKSRDRQPLVVYTGQLFPEKGVATLVEAARHLPAAAVQLAGGTRPDVDRWRCQLAAGGPSNVELLGHLPPDRIPRLQQDADVLVLPNSGRYSHSARDSSPMKLFEYMAAGRPIVASDVPAIREVLSHGSNAWLVPPDDPTALARGIETLLDDPLRAERLAARARADVQRSTWICRAEALAAAAGIGQAPPEEKVSPC